MSAHSCKSESIQRDHNLSWSDVEFKNFTLKILKNYAKQSANASSSSHDVRLSIISAYFSQSKMKNLLAKSRRFVALVVFVKSCCINYCSFFPLNKYKLLLQIHKYALWCWKFLYNLIFRRRATSLKYSNILGRLEIFD